ncbi:hypothetical protein OROHE_010148 [Orobanche hederae]
MAPYKKQRALKNTQNTHEADVKKAACTSKPAEKDPEVAGASKSADVLEPPSSHRAETTVTTTDFKQRKSGGSRSVCAMHKVVVKKAQGKKLKITCNALGVPQGDNRKMLQSYICMLARTMVPIDINKWPEDTFKIPPQLERFVLKSVGSKWRQFKTNLTNKFVMSFIGQKKKLGKPPRQYAFVGKSAWRRFIAQRTSNYS